MLECERLLPVEPTYMVEDRTLSPTVVDLVKDTQRLLEIGLGNNSGTSCC